MKRNLLLLAAAMGFVTASFGQTSYGLKAGLNFPKFKVDWDGGSMDAKTSTNFYLTGYADVNIAPNLSIQPGISLQGKGSKSFDLGFDEGDVDDSSLSLMYIEVPINFVYYIPAGMGNLFLGAGPYVGYGISVKQSYEGESESGSFDEANLKPFDAGANLLGGYKFANGFLINAGYSFGLTNIIKDAEGDGALKNRVLSVGVGFQF